MVKAIKVMLLPNNVLKHLSFLYVVWYQHYFYGSYHLVQIITVSSCKLQGKRANKAKKLIRELIQEETDDKSHKSNADTKQRTEN